jgi:hypothetical protein
MGMAECQSAEVETESKTMTRKRRAALCILSLLLLSLACAPTQSLIATAVAQTLTAIPPATSSPAQTPPPSDSSAPASLPSPTSDNLVIDVNPHEMLLTLEDLSPEPKYYPPDFNSIRPNRNSDVLRDWEYSKGQEYLDQTGRIYGWIATFSRGDNSFVAPEQIEDTVVLYSTSAGASLVITNYSRCDPANYFNPIPLEDPQIGDQSIACLSSVLQSDGQEKIWYYVEFRFRNFFHLVQGFGSYEDVRPGYIEAIAQTLLGKLQAAPLSNQVTFYPAEVFPLRYEILTNQDNFSS